MDWILNLDYLILLFVNRSLSFSFADWFFPFITDLHKAIVFNLIVFPLTFYVFYKTAGWKKGGLRFFLCLLVIGSTDFFCGSVLKKAFQRPRPPEVYQDIVARSSYAGYSMPSNHSANMFALATFIGKSVPGTRIPLTLMASTVAYSRIYNGVHYPSDVVVGAFIGYLISSLGLLLIRRLKL